MADHAFTRRRSPKSLGAEAPPERRDSRPGQPTGNAGAFDLIDLAEHPDGILLRLCAALERLRLEQHLRGTLLVQLAGGQQRSVSPAEEIALSE